MAKGEYLGTILPKLYSEYPTAASALRAFRAAGGRIRTQTFQRTWAEYGGRVAMHGVEEARDLRFAPTQDEILPMATVKAKGFAQEVLVIGRSRSGALITKRIEVPVARPTARWRVIKRAEEIAAGMLSKEGPKDTDITAVIAGVHVGTYLRTPGL